MKKMVNVDRLTDELLDIHCNYCEGENHGCTGCIVKNDILKVLEKHKISYKDGVCKWKNCKVSEIDEDEMEECSFNNDCENCKMNTESSSYDSSND